MKDEIKEILEALKIDEEDLKVRSSIYPLQLTPKEQKTLSDYITNLQDKIEELEQINEEHQLLNGMLRKENNKLKKLKGE